MRSSRSFVDMLKKDKLWFEGPGGHTGLSIRPTRGLAGMFAQQGETRPDSKRQFAIHSKKTSERPLGKSVREVKAIGSVF